MPELFAGWWHCILHWLLGGPETSARAGVGEVEVEERQGKEMQAAKPPFSSVRVGRAGVGWPQRRVQPLEALGQPRDFA